MNAHHGEGAVVEGKGVDAAAFRRLYPTLFVERHLEASIRPDGRALGAARLINIIMGQVPTAEGSALVRIGDTTMLAGIKLEVFVPPAETPNEGRLAVNFRMPPICSPHVRPGNSPEAASVITEQLTNSLTSSKLLNLEELSITSGKAAWIAYLDIYCLNADGALIDAALLACVASLANLKIPAVSVNDDGKVQRIAPADNEKPVKVEQSTSRNGGMDHDGSQDQVRVKASKCLKLGPIPVALTCLLHKSHLLVDPTAEEEDVLHTTFTVVLDAADQLIAMYKPGGPTLATTSTVQDCIALARLRLKEVQKLVHETLESVDSAEE